MSRRALAKAGRRARILDAARAIVASDGIEGLSMRKVARAAGLSVTTLYNLLGSKDDIRLALTHDLLDALDVDLAAIPLERPIERAEAVITLGVSRVVAEGEGSRAALLAGAQAPAEPDPAAPRAAGMQRVAFQAAMEQGLLRDDLRADTLAAHVYLAFGQAALGWACGRLDVDGFRDHALYGLYVCLLAAATDALRPRLVASITALEPRLARAQPQAA